MIENSPAIDQLRERSREYPSGSPQREAFLVALIRYEYAEEDARIDAVLMNSWRIRYRAVELGVVSS